MKTHLSSSDWDTRPVSEHSEASAFIVDNHYSKSTANTSTVRTGLYRDNVLLGVALWIPPTKNAARTVAAPTPDDWRGVLCLTRLAVHPSVPTNGASFLLGASMRSVDRETWPVLLTYADTAHGHSGAIYRATNWIELGAVKAGDCWIGPDGEQRGRKRGGRTLLAADMVAMGFRRVPAAPKVKFIHLTRRHRKLVDEIKAR